ncbi:MAG: polyprenyl synthetase family protein [Thiotrichales bacterium]|nr:polyprenyl synthetase family protein [Thiotrichales bacterium]
MQTELNRYRLRVEAQLKKQFETVKKTNPAIPEILLEALAYATLNSGKRMRPALIYAVGEALKTPIEQLDSAACAIELIHSYSLVHDDLPAMDDDDLRRGLPTCHIQYDEATAILVGDAQQTLAFELLSEDPIVSDKHKLMLIQCLSQAAGVSGMIGGQMMDIQSEGQSIELAQLKTLHQMKTGALIKAALLMGAVQSPNYHSIKTPLSQLGEFIGLAFQVHDDILDIESDSQTLGKPQGSDLLADKSTYPKLMGLAEAKHYRDALISQAKAQLKNLQLESPFLVQLIEYIAKRNH